MRIIDAITQLQNVKPNQYDEALMVSWLSDVDGLIYNEYIKWHEQPKTEPEPEPEVPEEPEEAPTLPEKDTLANTPWEGVKLVADAVLMDSYGWNIHDTKTVRFNEPVLGMSSIVMEYVGKNYDDLADGSGKAPMSFLMRDIFADETIMHDEAEVPGGWTSSTMYTDRLPQIFAAIEDAIGPGIISPVIKYTSTTGNYDDIKGAVASVWQPSQYEMGVAVGSLNLPEKPADITTAYPAFTSDTRRVKKRNGTADYWWLRTFLESSITVDSFGSIRDTGGVGGFGQANASLGLVIGFCVGHPPPVPEQPEPERIKPPYDPELDMDTVLLVPEPYSNLYVKYLAAQVDYFNGELARYDNSMTLFNAALSAFADWYNRNNMPRQDNYIIF